VGLADNSKMCQTETNQVTQGKSDYSDENSEGNSGIGAKMDHINLDSNHHHSQSPYFDFIQDPSSLYVLLKAA